MPFSQCHRFFTDLLIDPPGQRNRVTRKNKAGSSVLASFMRSRSRTFSLVCVCVRCHDTSTHMHILFYMTKVRRQKRLDRRRLCDECSDFGITRAQPWFSSPIARSNHWQRDRPGRAHSGQNYGLFVCCVRTCQTRVSAGLWALLCAL